jgi:predicted DNA-binding transcriptional regulator AlpA
MEHKLISAAVVRDLCGGVSDMTVWRWINHPEMGFPRPIYISRRRYWREIDITGWLADQAERAA